MAKLVIRKEQKQGQFFTENLGNGIGLDMVFIPGGSFMMGTEDKEIERLVKEYEWDGYRREKPQHQVTVPNFFMGRYPVTQGQWREVAEWESIAKELDSDPSNFKEDYEGINRWMRPVERISWEDAKEFCNRLSKKTKREYRIPTEAEWEYACRAGTSSPFHFGETISTDLANYAGNKSYGRGSKGIQREQTTPVGYFQVANNFGLSDMHGLVWEWCEDDWDDNYRNASTDGSAWLSDNIIGKVIRGGSWGNDPYGCRSAYRYFGRRNSHIDSIGFRVVCVAPRNT
ncbi:MAG: formylglycine-generating enzyme family protein [Cyanobacteria bacterium P01_F01_bin.143]